MIRDDSGCDFGGDSGSRRWYKVVDCGRRSEMVVESFNLSGYYSYNCGGVVVV